MVNLIWGQNSFEQGSHSLEKSLKSPWIPFFLEKSLNFCESPWKVLEFSSTLNVWPGKCFLMLFGCLRQNINHSSENLSVIYIKCSVFYAIINYQFKTSELKECREVGEANSSSLKVLLEYWEYVYFCTICEIIFLEGGPWKSNVVLEKSLENGCIFLYEPCWSYAFGRGSTAWLICGKVPLSSEGDN